METKALFIALFIFLLIGRLVFIKNKKNGGMIQLIPALFVVAFIIVLKLLS